MIKANSEQTSLNEFAPGVHVLLDLHGASGLNDCAGLERALRKAADAVGATVLGCHMHAFPDRSGVTGVLLLSESHMSLHTWPEIDFAAVDIFLCGQRDPDPAVEILQQAMSPSHVVVSRHKRGEPQTSPA